MGLALKEKSKFAAFFFLIILCSGCGDEKDEKDEKENKVQIIKVPEKMENKTFTQKPDIVRVEIPTSSSHTTGNGKQNPSIRTIIQQQPPGIPSNLSPGTPSTSETSTCQPFPENTLFVCAKKPHENRLHRDGAAWESAFYTPQEALASHDTTSFIAICSGIYAASMKVNNRRSFIQIVGGYSESSTCVNEKTERGQTRFHGNSSNKTMITIQDAQSVKILNIYISAGGPNPKNPVVKNMQFNEPVQILNSQKIKLANIYFENNASTPLVIYNSDVTMASSKFVGNQSKDPHGAGAIVLDHLDTRFVGEELLFYSNKSPQAGAIRIKGGARAELRNTAFSANEVTLRNGIGGAILVEDPIQEGEAPDFPKYNLVARDETSFYNNKAHKGGAIALLKKSSAHISQAQFHDNQTRNYKKNLTTYHGEGGAIYGFDSQIHMTEKSLFTRNRASFAACISMHKSRLFAESPQFVQKGFQLTNKALKEGHWIGLFEESTLFVSGTQRGYHPELRNKELIHLKGSSRIYSNGVETEQR